MKRILIRLCLLWFPLCGFIPQSSFAAAQPDRDGQIVGVARVDITPGYAVRLSGYGNRRAESEGVGLRIWAKALAIGADPNAAVLMTVENCGVPDAMRIEVLARLKAKAGITSERFAISFSHTHCAPCLKGALVNIFSSEVPAEHQARIDRYSRELTDNLELVALAALADRQPATFSWSVGRAQFARNRRASWGGPVDHSLPALFVHDARGALRAVFASYACHATTLQFNQIHGDWPGTAMQAIERDHPGVVALIGIGCGADQNPNPRGTLELAAQHGEEIAAEVARLLKAGRKPVTGALSCHEKQIMLPLEKPPTRDELIALAASQNQPAAYAAKGNLARLDRGVALATELPYRVQVWNFGSELAMAFLPGEITIDYQLRLKIEFDAQRLWINGYCNDALCYIPSRRVLAEGGYEGMSAMVYYDRPAKFAEGIEERIIGAVHELMPEEFARSYRADVPPKSPADSLAAIQLRNGLAVELVAAEPFVADPVAVDWDARGRMWVVEQPDYPNGMDGNWKPGGRVRILTDTDGDGRHDRADVFLEGIPFPTGITCWRGGALVCAAPDILYAEDTNGDNKADKIEKRFTGFYTDNYNARINSLALGLDGWLHGANGLLGGKIRSVKTGAETDIAGRDVRLNPDTGELQLVSGVTQQGRARDDFDNWFGCSNSRWIFHFPLPEACVRRNPHVNGPAPLVYLPAAGNAAELQPASRALERFNNPTAQGHITSACGLGIYRDDLLGAEFAGNAFIGETAHNLIRRYRLDAQGATFEAHRPDDETAHEFLASTDNWTRPVQIRTGPDGALYIVDMYRAVIEHTRWIPADRLAKLDVRAGDDMGRIYRIVRPGVKLRPVHDLTKLDTAGLVAALDTPNGTTRDLIHQLLLHRADRTAHEPLTKLAATSRWPAVRAQALSLLDAVPPSALKDKDARVRRHAIRLSEHHPISSEVLALARDTDFTVRYQLALSLGEWNDPKAATTLADMACAGLDDPWFRAAVVSSSSRWARTIMDRVRATPPSKARDAMLAPLVATAAAVAERPDDFAPLLDALTPAAKAKPAAWQMTGLAQVRQALARHNITLTSLAGAEQVRPLFTTARDLAADETAPIADRKAAIGLFGRGFGDDASGMSLLATLLRSAHGPVQNAAIAALASMTGEGAADAMLASWPQHAPALRARIIETLLARDAWVPRLLRAIEHGVINPAEVPAASRQTLARHTDATIRARSARLLPVSSAGARAQVVEKYQVVSGMKGDAVKGATVFKRSCFACHSYLGQGIAVGPDLKAFYNKSTADFATAILNPNAAVEPRYAAYVITIKDGRALTGVIASETATSIEVVMPGGLRETILRGDLRELRAVGLSLMPDGLEQGMTPQDLADLIAYLKSGG